MTKLTPETETALRLPIGVVSPLWMMFAGAAMTGAAFYWARSWYRPINLEALTPLPEPEPEAVVEAVVEAVEPVVEAVVEAAEPVVEAVEAVVDDVAETVELAADETAEVVEEAAATVEAQADDLTRLTGIGPKLAVALAERGVTRFADIAAWTEDDVARFDKDLKLMGRVAREAWIAQAGRYAAAVAN